MITNNFQLTSDGVLLASGPGVATVTAQSVAEWLLHDNDATAPDKSIKHTLPFGVNVPMELDDGEHLWGFGKEIVAVSAEVPGPAALS